MALTEGVLQTVRHQEFLAVGWCCQVRTETWSRHVLYLFIFLLMYVYMYVHTSNLSWPTYLNMYPFVRCKLILIKKYIKNTYYILRYVQYM